MTDERNHVTYETVTDDDLKQAADSISKGLDIFESYSEQFGEITYKDTHMAHNLVRYLEECQDALTDDRDIAEIKLDRT